MFRSNTVFVVGAGANASIPVHERNVFNANCGLEMPVGTELASKIATLLNIRFDRGSLVSGDIPLVNAFRRINGNGRTGPLGEAAVFIKDAMPQAISIDNFIDAHRGNRNVELCSKLAIVRSILLAERGGPLYLDAVSSRSEIIAQTSMTWLARFFRYLTENVSKPQLREALSRVYVICFNYDRCIEHFLPLALANYYGLSDAESQSISGELSIFHPYGTVGKLPWQDGDAPVVGFGQDAEDASLLTNLSSGIKTFSEQADDGVPLAIMKHKLADAELVVFLGFAFHRRNLELITLNQSSRAKRVLGTARGFSESDALAITNELSVCLSGANQIDLNRNLYCHDFFDEYKRTLSNELRRQ